MAPPQDHEVIVIDDDDDDISNGDIDGSRGLFLGRDGLIDLDDDIFARGVVDYFDGFNAIENGMDQPLANNVPPQINPRDSVRAVFPDICPDYLERLTNEYGNNSDVIIDAILDSQEKGEEYPRQPVNNPLKRKRAHGIDDDGGADMNDIKTEDDITKDIKAKISQPGYHQDTVNSSYKKLATKLLSIDFPKVHMSLIRTYLTENSGSLFKTYTAMKDIENSRKDGEAPWPEKKTLTPCIRIFEKDHIGHLNMNEYTAPEQLAIAELRAARDLADFKQGQTELRIEEENNFSHAKLTGKTEECGCCFEECAINRMIHCDGENPHRFCRDCMKSQVDANIGLSKYELTCMSMDGCSAGFEGSQRKLFLDKKTLMALDRLEIDASLRMAGLENLETCPFCPYAAEYPPPEVNKEFRCDNPECEKISCRLCRKESHIPRTCEENAADHGLSARHVLEEAMSEALIRKCNNCQHPYVKLEGCNKITCTRCRTLQCYVCRKTIIGYNHFNDPSRGGHQGQCPLYDKTEQRHEEEIRQAEETTRKKVEMEHPGLTADALSIKVSDEVKKDEERRLLRPHEQRRLDRQRAMFNPWEINARLPQAGMAIPPPIGRPEGNGPDLMRARIALAERHAQVRAHLEERRARAARERGWNLEPPRLPHPVAPRVADAGEGAPVRPIIGGGNPPIPGALLFHALNTREGGLAAPARPLRTADRFPHMKLRKIG
ncbi:uncharacterized protein GGS22DRAFT_150457 [Annulohypoxylon maeteangense]|uniref:uncharacterized protein n=1 Tax=Annulohypoxylon maeteangense TaxID=1927788 RepID=UPI002007D474|nr:uncharacterized protein GGS22DRAFT_150457 [Annulohypoxylon maeteangense]KAI0890273.1 hypothetical protein GGS22DRAFT_150457 [Annulohypoxylon maeteangense]